RNQSFKFGCRLVGVVSLSEHQMFKFPDCLIVIHISFFQDVCVLPATNNLFAPEMAKNSPSETRTSRMAYCSKSLLPSSANWTNRFQSTSYPSIGFGLEIMCPSVRPIERAMREPRRNPQSTVFPAQPCRP